MDLICARGTNWRYAERSAEMEKSVKPIISIIIPCFNVELYISKCIESLVNQTIGLDKLELIFVNDASTDTTLDILLEYEKRYSENITVINLDTNVKQGGARNVGMQYATAEYLGFVDSDDWVELNMFEHLYNNIIKYDCDIVGCGMLRNFADGRCIEIAIETLDSFCKDMTVIEGADIIPNLNGGVYTKIYRASIIFDNNIWFPEHISYEDNYWGSIVALNVKSIMYIKEYLYHYRENFCSTTLKRNAMSHFDRLEIEIMKIKKYKELGVFDRFYEIFEREFLCMYFFNTLHIMFKRFDNVQYNIFLEMQNTVKKYFPNYLDNIYMQNPKNPFWTELIKLVDLDMTEEELQYIANVYNESIN